LFDSLQNSGTPKPDDALAGLTGNMFPPHASANLTADISGLADFALVGRIGRDPYMGM
jgi:hypothetical protein